MTDITEEVPMYRILNEPGYWAEDEKLYPPGSVIGYTGTPTEHWEPLNEAARKRMADYLDMLEACHQAKLIAEGHVAYPRPTELAEQVARAMANRPRDRERVFPSMGEEVPLMGNQKKRGRPPKDKAKLVSAKMPDTKAKLGPPVPILGNLPPPTGS